MSTEICFSVRLKNISSYINEHATGAQLKQDVLISAEQDILH